MPSVDAVEDEINNDPDSNVATLDIPDGFDFKTSSKVKITIYDSEPTTLYKVYNQFGTTDELTRKPN